MTLHQAAQKAVEAVPRFRWDQDMDVLAGPYPDGEWVRRADVIAALQQQPEPVACPRCSGTGEILSWGSTPGGRPMREVDTCPACGGTGEPPALQHQEVPREPEPSGETLVQREEVCDAWSALPDDLRKDDRLTRLYHALGGPRMDDPTDAASPSTTRQQEVGGGAAFCPCSFCDSADACRERGCADAAYGREVAGRRAAAGGHTGDTERVRCVSCEWRGLVTDCAGFEQCDCPMCLAPVTDCPEAAPSTPENAGGGPHG